MVDDRQTHSLPEDEAGLAAIATFLGYPDSRRPSRPRCWPRCAASRATTRDLFEEAPSLAGPGGNLVFTGTDDDPGTLETLRTLGFRDAARRPRASCGAGITAATAPRDRARARELLTELMPALLKALGATAAPDQALLNFDLFLGNLPAGVQLFSLFKSNPALLELVAAIMGSAPGLAAQLARRTVLLDSVLSPAFYRPLPPAAEMTADLAAHAGAGRATSRTSSTPARRWTNDRRFQVGVQQLKRIVRPAAGRPRLLRHRRTRRSRRCATGSSSASPRQHGGFRGQRLAVLGMGKLGSREMSATSDLDLIFVYDIPPGLEASDGAQPLAPIQYYTRLSAKIVTALTALTNEGALYEVDMRLRPSGRAGPLANSLEGFESYHAQSAWTWEHMALTRARVIHGPAELVERLRRIVQRHALPAARSDGAAARRRRHARPHRPPCAAQEPVGLQAPAAAACSTSTSSPSTWRCATPPSGRTCSTRIRPRCCAAPPTAGLIDRTDAERLRAARTLLSDVQSLLRLTLNGDEAAFDEAQGAGGPAPADRRRPQDVARPRRVAGAHRGRDAAARAIYRRIVEAAGARRRLETPQRSRGAT